MEFLDVVDDKNQVIGIASREEIYAKRLTHRIVHVFVINPKNNHIYFQKRSDKVNYLPGYYCTSAGGHVLSGESYEKAAIRELNEELGINPVLRSLGNLEFISGDGHKRFIEVFLASVENGFNFVDGEVESGIFLDVAEAKELIDKGEKIHPQLDFCFKWLIQNKQKLSLNI